MADFLDSISFKDFCVLITGPMIGIAVIALVLTIMRIRQKNKPLIKKHVKVIEKTTTNNQIEWFVVEMENGGRVRLRNFNADKILILEGDTGEISYRGITIEGFISDKEKARQ